MNNNLNVSPEIFKIERLQLQLDEIQSTELGKKIFSDCGRNLKNVFINWNNFYRS